MNIAFKWRSNAEGERDGGSITLRVGAASVCATIVRPAVGREVMRGASFLEYLRGRGFTATLAPAPRLGVALAGAIGPAQFVEGWRWRKNPENVRNARETSLWFTRDMVGWRWRAEPRERSLYQRNTPTDGFATWARVILGERDVREVHRFTRDVVVPMPEGDYAATATTIVTEEVRARVPAWLRELAPQFTRTTTVTTERVIEAPIGMFRSHTIDGDDPEAAARAFAERVEARRAERSGWALPLRMRASGDDVWEAYHHASGEWRSWGTAKREALPKEARVEECRPCSDEAIARVLTPKTYGVEVGEMRKRLGREALEHVAELAEGLVSANEVTRHAAQVEVARARAEAQAKIAALGPNAAKDALAGVLAATLVPPLPSWAKYAVLGGLFSLGVMNMAMLGVANVGRV
jgi:hypothetical protein